MSAVPVSHQKALWDKFLEMRISLQQLLTSANRLPQGHNKSRLCQAQSNVKEAYELLTISGIQTLACLLDLEEALLEKNDSISGILPSSFTNNRKDEGCAEPASQDELQDCSSTSVESTWDRMNSLYSSIIPYRDNSVDRWQRKTQLSSGAVSKGQLRAFNQSISQQIAGLMKDSSRLVSRTRPKRNSIHILGQTAIPEGDVQELKVSGPLLSDEEEEETDPECFVDMEFYQQLLREYLESSSANGSIDTHSMRKVQNKKRKLVDRRASKGRKIRYAVFDRLLNFMAPEPMNIPPMASQVFANLFGNQKKLS